MNEALARAAIAVSESTEVSLVVKATLVFAAGLLAVRLLPRARASVRHSLLAATFGALAALPLLLIAGPRTTIDVRLPREITPLSRAAETGASRPSVPAGAP